MSSDPRPLRHGGDSPAERRAAEVLERAAALEQAELDQVHPGRVSARLAQRLAEGEWPVRRPRKWVWWGAGLALAGSLALLAVVLRPSASGVIVTGEVLAEAQGRWLRPGNSFEQDQLLGATRGAATLRLHSRALVTLSEKSRVRAGTHGSLTVLAGSVELEVDKRRAGERGFVVSAEDVTVTVVGTRFRVLTDRNTGVGVKVSEGRVRVDSRQGSVLLDPSHEEWHSRPQADPLFDAAARLTQAGQLTQARALYITLAQSDTPSAETALYLHARLEMRALHDLERALALLTDLERRFPNGSLARERLQAQLEVLVALARCEPARKVLLELQRRFPAEAIDEGSLGACQP